MSFEEYATYREIVSQTQAWTQALELARSVNLDQLALANDQVIFTGCGSTYYLSLAAAPLYQELTGRPARAISGGEMLLNPQMVLTAQRTLLVAVSRSGTTTETVKAVDRFKREKRGDVLVISNHKALLSDHSDARIIIPAGQEQSVAQTRSFASMYVAATAFCAHAAGRQDLLDAMRSLPAAGGRLISKYDALAREIGENLDYDRFYFLGSGIRYGLACETNLKMKEMTLTHSEPFHFLEFRHGPISMVNEKALVVGMLSDDNAGHEKAVLKEIENLGGKTVSLAQSDADVVFDSQIPENVRGVLYLPILQLMAFYRSLAKGLNPDRPKNLAAVVQLSL